VTDEDELMFVTRQGVINRQHAREIRVIGRNTQGVRLVSLDEGDELMDVARVVGDLANGGDEADAGDAADDGTDAADDGTDAAGTGAG